MAERIEKIQNILMYSNRLAQFDYGNDHPFKPRRAAQMMELLNRYSLIFENNQKVIEPGPLDEKLLRSFHSPRYIDILKKCDSGEFSIEMLSAGIGNTDNPVVPGMFNYALTASGGTYSGALMLARDEARFVFNPHGGFHHAARDYGEGFCYINDIAIAAMELVRLGRRIAYIDIDAHHGNGVQDAFYTDNRVLTISLHESGKTLYPWSGFEQETGAGQGRGYNVNIPLMEGTDDEVYVHAFSRVVPPLLERFKPDIVFLLVGGDAHRDDPLAHLNLTSNGYKEVLNSVNRGASKILAMGGGGYNVFKTASIWALAWATLCGIKVTDDFAGLVGGMMYGPEAHSGSLEDGPFVLKGPQKDACFEYANNVIQYIEKNIFPVHGI